MRELLGTIGTLCVVVLGCLILWAGIGSLITMDESSKSQGGRYYVGAALIVALVWLVGQVQKFRR